MCHESGFLGEYVGRCHPGFGCRRRAVELQNSLRRLNLQETVETRPRPQRGCRQRVFPRRRKPALSRATDLSRSNQSRLSQVARCSPSAKTVAEKSQVDDDRARHGSKPLTRSPTQIKTAGHHHHSKMRSSSVLRLQAQGCCKAFGLEMHFSFYLVIAALVVLGAEVAYALYQLVNLTL